MMKKNLLALIPVLILTSCGKTEEGFLDRELSAQERNYLLNSRKDKCLKEESVKEAFDTISTKSTNSFSSLNQTMTEYNSGSAPKSLVYQKKESSNLNLSESSTETITELYIVGFNGAKDEFYYVSADKDGKVTAHGKYSITNNGDKLVSLKNEYCTYRSGAHSLDKETPKMDYTVVIETTPQTKVKNVVTKKLSVKGDLPLFFSQDPTEQTDVTTDDRGTTRKVTTNTQKVSFARIAGKYSSLNSAAKPFCEYYESTFEELGDCNSLNYSTIANAFVTKLSK